MKTLKITDMHCEKCVERISKALSAQDIEFTINLENKTVAVDDNKVTTAIETLDDIGFSAEE